MDANVSAGGQIIEVLAQLLGIETIGYRWVVDTLRQELGERLVAKRFIRMQPYALGGELEKLRRYIVRIAARTARQRQLPSEMDASVTELAERSAVPAKRLILE